MSAKMEKELHCCVLLVWALYVVFYKRNRRASLQPRIVLPRPTNVRLGSVADIGAAMELVRFVPVADVPAWRVVPLVPKAQGSKRP